MPEELENLIEIARIKILAKGAGAIKISQRMDNFVFYFNPKNFNMDIAKLVEKYKNKILFSQGKDPYITLKAGATEKTDKQNLQQIKELLNFGDEVKKSS